MKTQKLVTLFLILFSLTGYVQNVSTGEVIAVIPFGAQSYSLIHEDGTENYYKTSAPQSNTLIHGQAVELQFSSNNNSTTIEVTASNLSTPLYCQLITPSLDNYGVTPLLMSMDLGYRNHVGYNSDHNVLVFQTWNDVRELELLIEENSQNYPYNQGNENAIFNIMNLIRIYGWTMSTNPTGNKVSLPQFKDFLDNSYPLSSDVLNGLIVLDQAKDLDATFIIDVFTANFPLSYTTEQRLISSTMAPAKKNQILDDNDNFLDAPNHVYRDFIATFPGYYSLYEKLNTEELAKLQSRMDPADPDFDRDPVTLPFERLIMNDKYEVWIEGYLYKLYEDCRAISMHQTIDAAYLDLSVLNPDGSPSIPQLSEGPQGLSQQVMDDYVPSGYMVYNPLEYDPLGSVNDDPHYETALQSYNFVTGCPVSNYTYSLYTTSDLTVDFYNMTDFSDIVQPLNSFHHYWTFGDGTGSFQNDPSHTYSDYGIYTVRLTTFNADCGCWHVHKYEVDVRPPQLREGNPDCPFKSVFPTIAWNQNPLSVQVVAEPNPDDAVPPNTAVVNYIFYFYDSNDNLVYEEDRGVLDFIFYTFSVEGEYYAVVKAIWDGGCESISDQHPVTVNVPQENQTCCDKKDRTKDKDSKKTYNEDEYCLKIKDLARGSFGTTSWRKIQGTQKLYVKKKNKNFWKKQPAWHIITANGTYWDRTEGNDICTNEQPFDKANYICSNEDFKLESSPGNFPNKFGLKDSTIIITHTVYLGGTMYSLPATPHCCDCANAGGHLLFNQTIKLGECDN